MSEQYQLLSVGTGRPAELQRLLQDPESAFYDNPSVVALGLTPQSDLVQRLLRLSSGGTDVYPHNFNVHTREELDITMEELRSLGDAIRPLNLMITVSGRYQPSIQLLSSEFNHWQGTGAAQTLEPGPDLSADVWANREDVLIQDMGPRYTAGEQRYHMESIVGERRMIGRGPTREYSVNYGSVEIIDRDPGSPTFGHPLNMGDGALDAYIPEDLMNQVRSGQPLYGPVLIRLRAEGTRPDPRVYYLSPELPDARTAILRESDNWQEETRLEVPPVLAGVAFPRGTMLQEGLIRDLNTTGSRVSFIALSGAQYQAWQYALSEHSNLRNISLQRWIDDTFGGREQFDAAFSQYPDGQRLPIEEYHRVMGEVINERVAESDTLQLAVYNNIARSRDARAITIVESYIDYSAISANDGSREGDRRLSTNELGAIFELSRTDPERFAELTRELSAAGVQFASNEAINSLPVHGSEIIQRG